MYAKAATHTKTHRTLKGRAEIPKKSKNFQLSSFIYILMSTFARCLAPTGAVLFIF
jgi:hypothetical protein